MKKKYLRKGRGTSLLWNPSKAVNKIDFDDLADEQTKHGKEKENKEKNSFAKSKVRGEAKKMLKSVLIV